MLSNGGLINLHPFKSISCHSIHYAGICGLYLFAAGSFTSVSMADMGMALMFVAFISNLCLRPRLFKDALLVLACLFGLYLVFQIIISTLNGPGNFALQFESASHLFRLGFFTALAPAFWLAQQKERYNIILLLILLSFITRIIMEMDVGDIDHFLNGRRAQLEMSPNSLGLYSAAAVLGLLVYARRFCGKLQFSPVSLLRISGWCLVLIFAGCIFVFAQSRAVWIAAALLFPPILLAQLIYNYRNKINKNSQMMIILAVILLSAAVWVWSPGKNIIIKRMVFETETLAQIVKGNFDDLKMDAYGLRINWWQLGFAKWLEKPVLGWGPYSVRPIMASFNKQTGVPPSHFHNFYLQILIQIGLIGFLFFVGQFIILFFTTRNAYRHKWLNYDDLLFIIGLFGLFAVASLSGLPAKDHFGRNYLALAGGIAYAFRFSGRSPDTAVNPASVENKTANACNQRPDPAFDADLN